MDSALKKLRLVHRNAPLLMQPRIAKVIEAVSNSGPNGIESPVTDPTKVKNTTLSLLQDNADSFLALMRTLPKKHAFKALVGEINSLATKLGEKIEESGTELSKLLESDAEDLPGIKQSALGELAELLLTEKTKLADIQDLGKTLATLAGKVDKEETTNPVEHELPSKDLGSKKKKKPGIGETVEDPEAAAKGPKPPSGSGTVPDLALM